MSSETWQLYTLLFMQPLFTWISCNQSLNHILDTEFPLDVKVWFYLEDINSIDSVKMVCQSVESSSEGDKSLSFLCHRLRLLWFPSFTVGMMMCPTTTLLYSCVWHDRNIGLTTTWLWFGRRTSLPAGNTLTFCCRKISLWKRKEVRPLQVAIRVTSRVI